MSASAALLLVVLVPIAAVIAWACFDTKRGIR